MGFRVSRSAAAGKQPEPDSVEVAMKKAIEVGLAVAARIKESKAKPVIPPVNPGLGLREYKKRKVGTSRTTSIRIGRVEKTVKVAAVPKKAKELRVRSVVIPSPRKPKTRMPRPGSAEANRDKLAREEREARKLQERKDKR
jgi:hypothetical protein